MDKMREIEEIHQLLIYKRATKEELTHLLIVFSHKPLTLQVWGSSVGPFPKAC